MAATGLSSEAVLFQLLVVAAVYRSATIALAGARNKQQAIQNAKAAHLALTPEDIDFIDGELDNLKLVNEEASALNS